MKTKTTREFSNATLIDILTSYVETMETLHMPQSRQEMTDKADEVYALLLHQGMTPAGISAAVPGVEVFG